MADTTADQKGRMLKRMVTIRRFEERVKELYHAGEIVGAIHLYIGEEAIAVGACEVLRDDDFVTSTHRSHGHTIAKVYDLKRTMAEMMGREGGLSRGVLDLQYGQANAVLELEAQEGIVATWLPDRRGRAEGGTEDEQEDAESPA